jgi:hypothetical protein
MISAIATLKIICTVNDASIETSLGYAMTMHAMHAQDANCSMVSLEPRDSPVP